MLFKLVIYLSFIIKLNFMVYQKFFKSGDFIIIKYYEKQIEK